MQISYATLYLKPTAAQQGALEKLLVDQQDPASPDYHRWVTPEEYAGRFGLSSGDISKINGWLRWQGLKVNDVARGRRWITFSGTAAVTGRAFHTEFHRYVRNGETHFANASPPSIPAALAGVIADVGGLDDYRPLPGYIQSPVRPTPGFTNGFGAHFLAPGDVATIYDLNPLYAGGFDGTGQTIAVLGQSDVDLTSIRNFRSAFSLPANDPQKMAVETSAPKSTDETEADLDLEWAGAVARNAQLIYVYADSSLIAAQYAIDRRVAPVISTSYAVCEPSSFPVLESLAQQANAEGITWVASSGDSGAASCDAQSQLPQASKGKAVGMPSSIPEVTSVGGTAFDSSGGDYWKSSNAADGGSALSYIPEKAWNDTLVEGTLSSSGGGASIFFAKPWWQTGSGVPNDNARDVPDVALNASWRNGGYVTYTAGGSFAYGGTSASAPVFAGMVSILNQYLIWKGTQSQAGLGNINPTLYRMAQTTPTAFHDITSGDNIVPCMQGTADCADGSFGFFAGSGWDAVTGLGSMDANTLVRNWAAGAPTTTSLTATPSSLAFNTGTVQLTAAVSASAGAPEGVVTFLVDDTSLGTATLSSGSATLTVPAIQLPVGTDTITTVYGGAGGLNGSAGTTTVTVTAPASSAAIVPSIFPNPVVQRPPDADGFTWFYTVTLANESAVAATLTSFSIGGHDYSANIPGWFGRANIPANGFIRAPLATQVSNPGASVTFVFGGTDANGGPWSQRITVPFIARVFQSPSLLLVTPASIPAASSSDGSCQWAEPLVVEERGGYSIRLTKLSAGSIDFSSQLQQIFGSTTIAPFGRLQGTLCWSSTSAPGAKTLALSGSTVEAGAGTETNASTMLSSTAAASVAPVVSPSLVDLSSGSPANVNLNFSGGSPAWTARISPANRTTTWIKVSPASGVGSAQLALTPSVAGLAKGVYNAMLTIEADDATPQISSVPVVLVVGGSSNISIGGVSNAASGKIIFAPGMLMSVYGMNLAPKNQHAGVIPLPLNMQGVSATINGFAAPLLDVTPQQLNVQIPYEAGAGTAILAVNNNGQVAYFPFQISAVSPGIFTAYDGTNNLVPYSSGARGAIVLAFITGEGDVTPGLVSGMTPTTTDPSKLPIPMQPTTITVGGVQTKVDFVGIPPGLVGVTQINFTIPADAPLGVQPVVVTLGGVTTQAANLKVTQ